MALKFVLPRIITPPQRCSSFFPSPSPSLSLPQAFDTATHAFLVLDMIRWDEQSADTKLSLYRKLVIVFAVWAMHAIANLVRRVESSQVERGRTSFNLDGRECYVR